MSNFRSGKVIAIILDAAEPRLIETWLNDGSLVNLRRLRNLGAYGRLNSSAKWLSGSPWPTFYTGTKPVEHGLYETKQWRSELMQTVPVEPNWLPLTPFWRTLDSNIRVISIDLPMTYAPKTINGVEISGWMTHDSISNSGKLFSYPFDLVRRIEEYGIKPVDITNEKWGLQNVKSLLGLKDQLIKGTQALGELAQKLLTNEKWDLSLVNFAAPHRGGHVLWDLSGTYGRVTAKNKCKFSNALKEVYIECDRAIGKIVESLDSQVNLLVFSLHGMQSNNNRSYLLPHVFDCSLRKCCKPAQQTPAISSVISKTKRLFPVLIRQMALPHFITRNKTFLSSTSKLQNNYSTFKNEEVLKLLSFQNGFIRVNLQGREKNGIVKPGEEYDKLCLNLIQAFESLVNADTGKQIIDKVVRVDRLYGTGPRLKCLPDIIVRWSSESCIGEKRIISRKYPQFSVLAPQRNLDGRSGNHTPNGFIIAVGRNFSANSKLCVADIVDLAPTIYHLLNLQKPSFMLGTPLKILNDDN